MYRPPRHNMMSSTSLSRAVIMKMMKIVEIISTLIGQFYKPKKPFLLLIENSDQFCQENSCLSCCLLVFVLNSPALSSTCACISVNEFFVSRWQRVHYRCGNVGERTEILLEHNVAYILWNSSTHRTLSLQYWIGKKTLIADRKQFFLLICTCSDYRRPIDLVVLGVS